MNRLAPLLLIAALAPAASTGCDGDSAEWEKITYDYNPASADWCDDIALTCVRHRSSTRTLAFQLEWCPHGTSADPSCDGDFRYSPPTGTNATEGIFGQLTLDTPDGDTYVAAVRESNLSSDQQWLYVKLPSTVSDFETPITFQSYTGAARDPTLTMGEPTEVCTPSVPEPPAALNVEIDVEIAEVVGPEP